MFLLTSFKRTTFSNRGFSRFLHLVSSAYHKKEHKEKSLQITNILEEVIVGPVKLAISRIAVFVVILVDSKEEEFSVDFKENPLTIRVGHSCWPFCDILLQNQATIVPKC